MEIRRGGKDFLDGLGVGANFQVYMTQTDILETWKAPRGCEGEAPRVASREFEPFEVRSLRDSESRQGSFRVRVEEAIALAMVRGDFRIRVG